MIDPTAIAALKVYPPIGVARVGNAQGADDYVIGPEVIGGAPTLPGATPEHPARFVEDFRTTSGEIKRQAARFRIYAHLKDGSVQEVTAAIRADRVARHDRQSQGRLVRLQPGDGSAARLQPRTRCSETAS